MTRFIILGSARTGSTLLTSLLNCHERIKVYHELFNFDELERSDLVNAFEDPINYMEDFYTTAEGGVEKVGFKIFYNHLQKGYFEKEFSDKTTNDAFSKKITDFQQVMSDYSLEELTPKFQQTWDYLRQECEIKVIHLKRFNKLESFVSLRLAMLTNQWVLLESDNRKNLTCELNHEECRDYFETIAAHEKYYDEFFIGHDLLEVSYEELVADQEKSMEILFRFLGEDNQPVTSYLKKQNTRSLAERIKNYGQLKQQFQGSEWEDYFVD